MFWLSRGHVAMCSTADAWNKGAYGNGLHMQPAVLHFVFAVAGISPNRPHDDHLRAPVKGGMTSIRKRRKPIGPQKSKRNAMSIPVRST